MSIYFKTHYVEPSFFLNVNLNSKPLCLVSMKHLDIKINVINPKKYAIIISSDGHEKILL